MSKVAELNDLFRKTLVGGKVYFTRSIYEAFDDEARAQLLKMIAHFDAFTEDNDPHGEHDFGAIDYAGRRVFWKIDYYNMDLECASPDPADPDATTRVLTVMFAEDY